MYKNGEHQVIQDPVIYLKGLHSPTPDQDTLKYMSYKLLYVHKQNDQERYIVLGEDNTIVWGTREDGVRCAVPDEAEGSSGYPFVWGEPQDGAFLCYDEDNENAVVYDRETGKILGIYENLLMTVSGTPKVTSLGKTLVIADDAGIHTFIWKVNSYTSVQLKGPEVDFWLEGPEVHDGSLGHIQYLKRYVQKEVGTRNDSVIDIYGNINDQEKYNDLVVGLYSKGIRDIQQKKGFCMPFFARAAAELYDGSFFFITNPVLLNPTVTDSSYAQRWSDELRLFMVYTNLRCTQSVDLTAYSDVIKDVVIFVTDGVPIYDIQLNQVCSEINQHGQRYFDVISRSYVSNGSSSSEYTLLSESHYKQQLRTAYDSEGMCHVLRNRESSEILKDLKEQSIYYRLCSIGLKPKTNINLSEYIGVHTLENLTTQERLGSDDYYSRCPLVPELMDSYNSRLLLANVKRGLFEGFHNFMPWDETTASKYRFYVYIETDDGTKVVRHEATTKQRQGIYFYYPDARAKYVTIYKQDPEDDTKWSKILNRAVLSEHTGLNGAFLLQNIPTYDTQTIPAYTTQEFPDYNNNDYEQLGNYVIQSEVSNPWVFPPSGYHKVSVGKITGVSSNVQALSQGQFGQHPLLVFTDRGIWAMTVSNTGLFESIHPMSREVCINPESITQTDNQVFFVGEKGLMATTEANVAAVSQQLMGKTAGLPSFATFCRACLTAFDSRDALLWLFGSGNTCYVYSIASGAYATKTLEWIVTNTVNNYPDFLLQTDDKVYSLLARPDINEDENTYTARLISRPMKLENALAMKSIMQVRHIADMEGTMTLRVFASNNLTSWIELHSLRGMPWKYYRFRYDFTGLKATDRFAGTVVVTQDRRANKMR